MTINEKLETTTYSQWSCFRNCRKLCEYRYEHGLVPIAKDDNLSFGSLIHEALRLWHGTGDLEVVRDYIDRETANRHNDERQRKVWQLAQAMMTGYVAKYPRETWEVVGLERTFRGAILNPETGATSRTFNLAGKVDGVVKDEQGRYFLLEHKTASTCDAGYISRLWCDFQITLYSWYLQELTGIPISGIIYNVLVKAKLVQKQEESEADFETRRAELLAKSKSGKTTATRSLGESNEDFQARLSDKYVTESVSMFHREEILIDPAAYRELQAELWELTQAYLAARRSGVWYKNTSQCFSYGCECPYFPLCRSGESEHLIHSLYEYRQPHGELSDGDGSPISAPLAF